MWNAHHIYIHIQDSAELLHKYYVKGYNSILTRFLRDVGKTKQLPECYPKKYASEERNFERAVWGSGGIQHSMQRGSNPPLKTQPPP